MSPGLTVRAHPPGDLHEQVVAVPGVAETVVDPLEVVEVDEEHGLGSVGRLASANLA